MNNKAFFDSIRNSLFGGKLTQGVVDTVNAITNCYFAEVGARTNKHHLAYMLATAYHESYHPTLNPDWNPVREGYAKSNAGAVAAVTKLYKSGRIKTNYALPDKETGHSYYGRGYVQITWKRNYDKMGDRIGVDLVRFPDLALQDDVAANLIVIGSLEGLYTGKKLSDYDAVNGEFDARNARRIINGTDKAEKIEREYKLFLNAINIGLGNE